VATPTTKKTDSAPKKKPAKAAAAPAPVQTEAKAGSEINSMHRRREVVGTVVSDKMQKTIVVKVDRQVRHALYKKYTLKSRRYKAHDEKNVAKIGDRVVLVESRPLSREKRWVLQSILRKASQVLEANV
jgi:small subunit ribosomal protein S17